MFHIFRYWLKISKCKHRRRKEYLILFGYKIFKSEISLLSVLNIDFKNTQILKNISVYLGLVLNLFVYHFLKVCSKGQTNTRLHPKFYTSFV